MQWVSSPLVFFPIFLLPQQFADIMTTWMALMWSIESAPNPGPPLRHPPSGPISFFSGLQVDASLLLEPDLYCWAGNGGGRPETAVLPEWFFVASLSSLPFITQVPHTHITHKHVIHTRCLQDQKRNKYLSLLKRQPRKKKKKKYPVPIDGFLVKKKRRDKFALFPSLSVHKQNIYQSNNGRWNRRELDCSIGRLANLL